MFTIRFAQSSGGYEEIVATATTIPQAITFVWDFAPDQRDAIAAGWQMSDGQYFFEICDWCSCWFPGQEIVLATVYAPPGFAPENHPEHS